MLTITADAADPFPGPPPDRGVMEIQRKVESLFENGDFERAMIIYRSELAVIGDKHAQYMIGYMYLAGKGVERDVSQAAAWYRLAAERGQDTFVEESRKLEALLTPEQRREADDRFDEIRRSLGDAVLINQLIRQDIDALGSDAQPSMVSFRTDAGQASSPIEKRLRARLSYARSMLGQEHWADGETRREFRSLERLAERRIRALRNEP